MAYGQGKGIPAGNARERPESTDDKVCPRGVRNEQRTATNSGIRVPIVSEGCLQVNFRGCPWTEANFSAGSSQRSVCDWQVPRANAGVRQIKPGPESALDLNAQPPSDDVDDPFYDAGMHSIRTKARVLARGMATAAPRIGDTKVKMSPLESGNYINYQRIEDNLAIVRQRYAYSQHTPTAVNPA